MYSTHAEREKCVLIGVVHSNFNRSRVEENLEELAALAVTAGAEIITTFIQVRKVLDSAYYLGKGKAAEICDYVHEYELNIIIFDDELTPAQIRNWEHLSGVKVIDRPALILDIFAAHARSRESRTQVELAQLNYMLPRLTRHWSHLSRQIGGIGTKGPGETQLETDRRLVRKRINHLKVDLERIERQRTTQGKKAGELIRISLIGYTNAGKSTLFNALTDANTLVEDKLFATLDTTTRRYQLENGITVLLSDTVGFIRKLPHHLIASFKSTLAQTRNADLLLHVVDVSDSLFQEHIRVVEEILEELNIRNKPILIIFNKVDKINHLGRLHNISKSYQEGILISAKKKIRLDKVRRKISKTILRFTTY